MDDRTALLVFSVLIGGAVGCGAWSLIASALAARAAAAGALEAEAVHTRSAFLRLMRPLARGAGVLIGRGMARLEMRLGRDSQHSFLLGTRIRIQKALLSAGNPEGLTPDEFLGMVAVCALGGLVVGGLVYVRTATGLFPLGFMVVFAWFPVSWLRSTMRRRIHLIRRMLPYTIDLLSLCVAAGLDFTEALTRIVAKLGATPLAEELGEMLRQIRLGKSRREALRDLARRIDLPELRSVVSALIQTDELGGHLAPILRAQSEQLRVQRSQLAEKLAMQAPVKILFPLIFCIFPTIFVMIFGPIALKLLAE